MIDIPDLSDACFWGAFSAYEQFARELAFYVSADDFILAYCAGGEL